MSRQDANAAFALSSFLQGTNAAYIDDLYARYEQDPGSVDAEWQEFFKSLKDTPADVKKNAEGASWGRDNWPLTPRDELTSALDGNWVTVGSYNIDHLSLFRNFELTAVVVDREVGTRMKAMFEADFAKCRELKLEEWRRRGWKRRVLESLCHPWRGFF